MGLADQAEPGCVSSRRPRCCGLCSPRRPREPLAPRGARTADMAWARLRSATCRASTWGRQRPSPLAIPRLRGHPRDPAVLRGSSAPHAPRSFARRDRVSRLLLELRSPCAAEATRLTGSWHRRGRRRITTCQHALPVSRPSEARPPKGVCVAVTGRAPRPDTSDHRQRVGPDTSVHGRRRRHLGSVRRPLGCLGIRRPAVGHDRRARLDVFDEKRTEAAPASVLDHRQPTPPERRAAAFDRHGDHRLAERASPWTPRLGSAEERLIHLDLARQQVGARRQELRRRAESPRSPATVRTQPPFASVARKRDTASALDRT